MPSIYVTASNRFGYPVGITFNVSEDLALNAERHSWGVRSDNLISPSASAGAVALIVGTAVVGNTLSVVLPSGWATPTSYQWTRDGVAISGATSSTYTQVSADIGHSISCTLGGLPITATSAKTIASTTSAATSDPVMFATVGRQGGFSLNSTQVQASQQYEVCRIHLKSPPWAVTAPQLLFAGFYTDQNSTIEHALGNGVLVQGVTMYIGGSLVCTYKAGGNTSWTTPNGGSIITDPDSSVIIPGNSDIELRVADYVPTGGYRFQAARLNLALSLDGIKQGSTDQSAALTGAQTWTLVRQTPMYGPAMIVGKGWKAAGKPPVPWVVGDSIGQGNNDTLWFQPSDGLYGYINHALAESASSTRYAFANSCIPGVSYSAFSAANFAMRQALFNLLPNFPASSVISEMGTNAGGGAAAVAGWPAYGVSLKTITGGIPIVQTTMLPKSTATSSSVQWSTTGNQVKVDFSAYNTFIRALGDPNMNGYIDIGGTMETAPDSGIWKVGSFATTVATDFVSGTNTLVLNAAPPVGTALFVGSGTGVGGALAGSSCLVQSVSGNTVTLQQSATGTAAAGTAVVEVNTIDGVHPLTAISTSTGAMAPVIAAKNAGTIK